MTRSLSYQPTSFDEIEKYLDIISKEVKESREITALLLIHSLIESYLREWLLVSGKSSRDKTRKLLMRDFERISIKNILIVHTILGNINATLFSQINQLLNLRNEIAHELAKVSLHDESNKNKISNATLRACNVCREIHEYYKLTIERKTHEVT